MISKIHLTAEDPPWDPSTSEYSERETQTLDHQGQISIPAVAKRGLVLPVFVSTVVSYCLTYNAADIMENDKLATALSAQIQISIKLICTIRKQTLEPTVLAKRLGIATRKLRRLFKPQQKEGLGLCSTLCCQDESEQIIEIFVIIASHILYYQTQYLPV